MCIQIKLLSSSKWADFITWISKSIWSNCPMPKYMIPVSKYIKTVWKILPYFSKPVALLVETKTGAWKNPGQHNVTKVVSWNPKQKEVIWSKMTEVFVMRSRCVRDAFAMRSRCVRKQCWGIIVMDYLNSTYLQILHKRSCCKKEWHHTPREIRYQRNKVLVLGYFQSWEILEGEDLELPSTVE